MGVKNVKEDLKGQDLIEYSQRGWVKAPERAGCSSCVQRDRGVMTPYEVSNEAEKCYEKVVTSDAQCAKDETFFWKNRRWIKERLLGLTRRGLVKVLDRV